MDNDGIFFPRKTSNGPYDHHCPQMGSGLNTWKTLCQQRQKFDSLKRICGAGDGCKALELEEKSREQQEISSAGINYREEVLALLRRGMSTQEISDAIGISKSTVKKHRRMEREKS